jgi:hypothetical protein
MLVRLDNLDSDIDQFSRGMTQEVNQTKQQGLQNILMVLSNCLEDGNKASGNPVDIGKIKKKTNESQTEEVRQQHSELNLERQRSGEEERKWAGTVMNLESELESAKRHLLREIQEKEKLKN